MAMYAGEGRENARGYREEAFLSLGAPLEHAVFMRQVHGSHIEQVGTGDGGRGAVAVETALAETDGLVSDASGIALLTQVADCAPVILMDGEAGAFGVLHSGWRGTAKRIAVKGVDIMRSSFGSRAKDISVWIGPAACGKCFEVGEDVFASFEKNDLDAGLLNREGKYFLDVRAIVAGQLKRSGVPEKNIAVSAHCTMEEGNRFFSYRREGECAGRMAVGVWKA